MLILQLKPQSSKKLQLKQEASSAEVIEAARVLQCEDKMVLNR